MPHLLIGLLLALAPTGPKASAEAEKAQTSQAFDAAVQEPSADHAKGPDVSKIPFNPHGIQAVVAAHLPEVQKCYNDVILENKKVKQGRVVVAFTISASGTVAKAAIKKSRVNSEEVQDCLLAHLRTWDFPKPPDGRRHPIEYPFDLKIEK